MNKPRHAQLKRAKSPILLATFAALFSIVTGSLTFFAPEAALATTPCVTANSGNNVKIKFSSNQAGCEWIVPTGVISVDVVIVGGGGSAGLNLNAPGGGGAGQVLYRQSLPVTPGESIPVTIGQGGAGVSSHNVAGNNGGNTVFGSVTALGGGGGGAGSHWYQSAQNQSTMVVIGKSGGSAGGNTRCGGATTPTKTLNSFDGWVSFGNDGGRSVGNCVPGTTNGTWGAAGGGGGAGSAGGNASTVYIQKDGSTEVTPGRGGRGIELLEECFAAGGDGASNASTETGYFNVATTGARTEANNFTTSQTCVTPSGSPSALSLNTVVNSEPPTDTGSGASTTSSGVAPASSGYFPGANGVVVLRYTTQADLVATSDTGSSSTDNLTGDATPEISLGPVPVGTVATITATRAGQASQSCTYSPPATSCSLPVLSDGTWVVSFTVNTSPQTESKLGLTLVVSTVVLPTLSVPTLAISSDTGNATDQITSDNTPTITVSGIDSSKPSLKLTASKSGSSDVVCTMDAENSTENCVFSSLSDGTWSIVAQQANEAGVYSPVSSPLSITIDTQSPVGLFTNPAVISNPESLTFSYTLTELPVKDYEDVDFSYSGAGCSDLNVTGSGTSYAVEVVGCNDGASVQVSTIVMKSDQAGNSILLVSSSVVVPDATAPLLAITSPSSPNNSSIQNFTITLSEAATGFDLADLSSTGTATGCVWMLTQTSSTVYTYSATGCGDGTVGVSVASGVVTDAAGNTGPAAIVNSSIVNIDHTAPVISWTMATPTWASVSALTPIWTLTGETGVGVVTRQVATLNSSNVCGTWSDDVVAASGTSATVSDRSCYRWKFTTAPTDDAGNVTTTNLISDVIMVDRSVAEPTITSGTPVANSNSYTATFTGETGTTFRCSLDGASAQVCTSPLSLTALADGSHTLAVYQTDLAGNLSGAEELTWSIDTQIQTVLLTAPSSPSNATTLSYTVVFDKNVTGVSAADFSVPNTSCSVASVTGSGRNYSVSINGCSHGDVATLRLADNSTTDASGNSGPNAITLASSVTIDTQAPSSPTVSFTGTTTSSNTAAINILGEAGASFLCSLDGGTAVSCTGPTYILTGLTVGSHTLTVTQTDLAGNVSSAGSATWTTFLPTQTLAPTPTISGNLHVGQTLTVTPGTFDSGTSQTIVWLRGGSAISGATGSTYVITASDLNASISVQVTSTLSGYQDTVVLSAGTASISRGSLSLTPNPSITGTTTYGQTLTANAGAWDSGVTLSYQWLRGGVAISGATSQTYTLSTSDIGTRISVAVTGSKTGYTSATTSALTAQNVFAATIPRSTTPTISGNFSNSSVLTANTGSWTAGVSYSYVWLRGTSEISGATNATYTLTADDIDATISVRVTGSLAGHNDLTLTSDSTSAITGMAQTHTPTPTISGTVSVGQTLTAVPGTWDSGVNLSYQWMRGSSLISGATSSTYVVTAADLNTQLSVRVAGTKTGYSSSVRQSDNTVAVAPGELSSTPTPTISGSAQVGSTLTVSTGNWDSGTSLTVQWLRDGVAVSSANSLTYVLLGEDYQTTISVVVVGAKTGYTTVTETSSAITDIQRGNLSSTPAPSIVGLPTVGQAVTASTTGWDSGVQFTYRWFADGTIIDGATSSTYVPALADSNKRLTVEVTGSKLGYISRSQTSSATDVVSRVRDFGSSSVPTISGVARNGETLTVNTGTWDEGTTITIQWMRTGLPVDGATGTSYTLSNSDISETITVIVRGTKTGYNPLSRVSNEVGPIALGIQTSRTPQVLGTFQVGKTVSANSGSWQGAVSLQYQWFADGAPLNNATSRTLDISPEQLGSALSVRVTASRVGYVSSSSQSNSVGPVVAGLQPATELSITGIPEVGEVLALNESKLDPAVTLAIQWLRDSDIITSERSNTYEVDQADIGHTLGARVMMNRAGYIPREVTVNASSVTRVNSSIQDMEIKGSAKIGEDLVVVKERCVSQATYTYQWLRDGVAIDGADSPTYTVTSADLGSTITAVATQFVDGEVTDVTVSKAFNIDVPSGPGITSADGTSERNLSFWEEIAGFFGAIWIFLTGWIIPGPVAEIC